MDTQNGLENEQYLHTNLIVQTFHQCEKELFELREKVLVDSFLENLGKVLGDSPLLHLRKVLVDYTFIYLKNVIVYAYQRLEKYILCLTLCN